MPARRKTSTKRLAGKRALPKESIYARTHKLSGKRLQFLLKAEDDALRERAASASSGRAAKTLVKEGRLRITLVALAKGTQIKEHQTEGPVSIQCLRGNVAIVTGEEETELTSGGLLVLDRKVPHAVRAIRESAILITMSHPSGK